MIPHLPGYFVLVVAALCYGVGVMSPAWRESQGVTEGTETITYREGPWWKCQYVNQKMNAPTCTLTKIADPLSSHILSNEFRVKQIALLMLTGLSTLLFLIAVVIGSALVCCRRLHGAVSKWMTVSTVAMFAGMSGLGSVIVFTMTQMPYSYIFGFFLSMGGAYLGIMSSVLIAQVPLSNSHSRSKIRFKQQDIIYGQTLALTRHSE